MIGVLSFHAAHSFDSTRHLHNTLGQVIVAYDRAREYVATQVPDGDVLIIGFDYGYNRRWEDGSRYHRETMKVTTPEQSRPLHVLLRINQDMNAIEHQTPIQQIQRSIGFPKTDQKLKVGIRPIQTFSGLTNSTYDKHVYGSSWAFGGILYKVTYGLEKS